MAAFKEEDLQFTPEEMSFFAEDTQVGIVPLFSLSDNEYGMLHCISGSFGPFEPQMETQVPLWVALALFKMKRCRIKPPAWLARDELRDVLEQERNSSAAFCPLPFHYIEIANLLFHYCRDCFAGDFEEVRTLVENIRKTRFNKLIDGLSMLDKAISVKMLNLSAMEINIVRPFFQEAQSRYRKLGKMQEPVEVAPSMRTGSPSQPVRQLRRDR